MPKQRKRTEIDFGDEEAVLADVAAALNLDPENGALTITENDLFGFTIYEIELGRDPLGRGGSRQKKEWQVIESEEQAYDLAVAIVKQDLEEAPENFNQDFIERHIDTDRLRRELESDVRDGNIETLKDRSAEEFWDEAEHWGMDAPEEDEDGELPEPDESDIETLADKQTDDQLKDPMEYLEEFYGTESVKKAIEIAGIDIDAAADDAVDTDGWEHFLARYDGNSHETDSGLVYWRTN